MGRSGERGNEFFRADYLISHSSIYFIVRAGNGIFAIATLAVFTRLLSPAEYGIYALGMAIVTVASAICFQWLSVAIGRFYPMHLDDPANVLEVAARGFWIAAAAATLLFLGALPLHEVLGVDPALIGILFLITVMLGRYTLSLQLANTQAAPVRYGFLSWAKGGGSLLVGSILIFYGMGYWGALLGFLAGLVLAVRGFSLRPCAEKKFARDDIRLSVEMLRYGRPLTLNFLAIVVVDVVDRFLIGKFLGIAYVAPYAAAYELVQQFIAPTMSILFLAAFPMIVKAFESDGKEATYIHLHALGRKLLAVGLPAAVGVGIFANEISEHIFADGYRQGAAAIMPWLATSTFIGAFKSYFFDPMLQLRHAVKYQGYIAMLMATINITLNILLLPRYGVIAAAWATLSAFTVGALASWIACQSMFPMSTLISVFWRSAVACAVMVLVSYLLPSSSGLMPLLGKVAAEIVTYAVMVAVLDMRGCRELIINFIRQHVR